MIVFVLLLSCFVITPLHAASKNDAKQNPGRNRYCLKREKWPYPPMKSPNGKYIARFVHGDGDTVHVIVENAQKKGKYTMDLRSFWGAENQREPWAKAASDINTVCWSPVGSILYTTTGPIYNSPAVHAWNVETGKIDTVFHPRTRYVYKGKVYPEYVDSMALRNVSSDGRYLIMDYEPDVNADKNNCGRYVVDTRNDGMIPYKKFKKKHPHVKFLDPYEENPECCP